LKHQFSGVYRPAGAQVMAGLVLKLGLGIGSVARASHSVGDLHRQSMPLTDMQTMSPLSVTVKGVVGLEFGTHFQGLSSAGSRGEAASQNLQWRLICLP
jgi:hypothetical protein